MAYFVIQVRTGAEIEVKEILKTVLLRSGDSMVKAIYAMETYAEIIREDNTYVDLSPLDTEDITDHLYVKRIQAGLNNLRTACDNLKVYKDAKSLALLDSYRDNIRELSKELRDARKGTKKISSVLTGYILVELNVDFYYFPDNLWHLVKSIPNVTGIPSKYNIPQEEVDAFFHQIDVTPEVEMEFEELLSDDEIIVVRNELLHEANTVVGTLEEIDFLEEIDSLDTNLLDYIEDIKVAIVPTNPMKKVVDRCKAFIHRKRQKIVMPSTLFLNLYNEIEMQSLFLTPSTFDFIHRFKKFAYQQSGGRIE
ncbi:transcription termination/antitermination NusG family protein [Sporosarcina sp. FSL K6-1508]|uniref:transcription termination/antitermination NusG family protein n=1 Tax=Sporosarcina sp. FSL K6-1508 TaxID=2921553 RepID=UPI0030FD1F7F